MLTSDSIVGPGGWFVNLSRGFSSANSHLFSYCCFWWWWLVIFPQGVLKKGLREFWGLCCDTHTRLERWSIVSHRLSDGGQPSKNHRTRWLSPTISFSGDGCFENHRKIAMVKFMILDYLIKIKGAFWVFPGRAPFWANFSPQEILKPIHCLWPSDIWVICTFCCSAIFCLFPQSYTIVAGGMEGGYSFQTPGANALRIFRPRLDRNFHSMSVFVGNCLNLEPI